MRLRRRSFLAGLGAFLVAPLAVIGEKASLASPSPATARTVHSTYSLGWKTSMDMLKNDEYEIMSNDLANAVRSHRERLAWSLLDDGFSNSPNRCENS